MLKRRLLSFCIGGIATKALSELIRNRIPFQVDPSTVVLVTISALALFYMLADKYLLSIKLFRYFVSFRMTRHEGFWAESLEHPKYQVSLGRIYYERSYDRYVYEGRALISLDAKRTDGRWRSTTFYFDEQEECFIFTCSGRRDFELNDGVLVVESFGKLKAETYDRMTGHAVDLGPSVGFMKEPVQFSMHLKKVKRRQLKKALGSVRPPRSDEEIAKVIAVTLTS